MDLILPDSERRYLRELAKRQAEYARLEVMKDRERMWFDLNEGKTGTRPPVIIETWTFDRDFMPENVYSCESDLGKSIEYRLLGNIRNHELIDDDKVMPDNFEIGWDVTIDEFGIEITRETLKDSQGVETAFQDIHPIVDLSTDLDKLSPISFTVDREKTLLKKSFLDELLGDLLPVEIRTGVNAKTMLTNRVITLMGMEAYFMAMYDAPDKLHELMAYLRDNSLSVMRWFDEEGLLSLNNRNHVSFGSSYNFTHELPGEGFDGEHVHLSDLWGASNSQETVGVSPELFHEFCFPYYRDVCEPFGLIYYGCCEPAHPFWDDISRLPHLKKVSISRWCDQDFMADALQDTGIVFSRKPNPNFLSVDEVLDEDGWAREIDETLDAVHGKAVLEFIIRDVYTLHGDIGNARKAVDIARSRIGKRY